MKQVFPGIRPRRLGTRGHSRYCYAAMRKTTKLNAPQLPQISISQAEDVSTLNPAEAAKDLGNCQDANADDWRIIKSWAEGLLNVKLNGVNDLVSRIRTNNATPVMAQATAGGRPNAGPRKYAQREPKEKRLMAVSSTYDEILYKYENIKM